MHNQKIKIIEANSTNQLEKAVNDFIEDMDRPPIEITFRTSFVYFEGGTNPFPKHIAQIRYNESELK